MLGKNKLLCQYHGVYEEDLDNWEYPYTLILYCGEMP